MSTAEPASPTPPDAAAAALDGYVRRTLVKLALGVGALFAGLALLGALFGPELVAITTAISNAIGFPGMALSVLLIDTLTLPVPPDAVLVVVAHGPLRDSWLPLVVGLGLVSALAGNIGYLAGGSLAQTRWSSRVLGAQRAQIESMFARYGAATVVLGALTPIPFSITCWAAGALRLRWSTFALITLLRVPRFVAYYWLIAASASVAI
jgi:membrane protein YqaA with SNARE-associated domain